MINFVDPRKATQIKYELSSSAFASALQLITMQKGRSSCHVVINNLIVFQMQYEHNSWTDISFKKKFISLCSMNSTWFAIQQKQWCFFI